MTARKNSNAGPRWYMDPALPEGRQDAFIWRPIRLDAPAHPPVPRRARRQRTTTPSGFRPLAR